MGKLRKAVRNLSGKPLSGVKSEAFRIRSMSGRDSTATPDNDPLLMVKYENAYYRNDPVKYDSISFVIPHLR